MFTDYTWQDWLKEPDKTSAAVAAVTAYKRSEDFKNAGVANRYYRAENDTVGRKVILKAGTRTDAPREKSGRRS